MHVPMKMYLSFLGILLRPVGHSRIASVGGQPTNKNSKEVYSPEGCAQPLPPSTSPASGDTKKHKEDSRPDLSGKCFASLH